MVCCSESSKSGEPCESGEQATSVSLVMGTTGLTQTVLKCLSQCKAEAKHAYSLKLLC